MGKKKLTDAEKKVILTDILGADHHSVGKNFPIFSEMIDGLGHFNDTMAFVELIPVLNTWLSGPLVSSTLSKASIAGVFLFPVQQMINLLNANETGLRMYSYRAISYTMTAWAFGKKKPMQSQQILSNIQSGPFRSVKTIEAYNKIWRETATSVLLKIDQICKKKGIDKEQLKTVFKAFGHGSPQKLSIVILKGFEKEFSPVSRPIWASNYSIPYPR